MKRILAIFMRATNFCCVFQHTNSGLIEANGDKYDVSNKHIDKTIEHKETVMLIASVCFFLAS